MKTKIAIIFVIIFMISTIMTSCGSFTITGTWYKSENTSYTFYANGTGKMTLDMGITGGIELQFKYTINDGILRLTYQENTGYNWYEEYQYSINGNEMVWKKSDSSRELILTKNKPESKQ